MPVNVRADEDPYVHSELFRRVSEGLMRLIVNPSEAAELREVGIPESAFVVSEDVANDPLRPTRWTLGELGLSFERSFTREELEAAIARKTAFATDRAGEAAREKYEGVDVDDLHDLPFVRAEGLPTKVEPRAEPSGSMAENEEGILTLHDGDGNLLKQWNNWIEVARELRAGMHLEARYAKLQVANGKLVQMIEEIIEGYADADLNWYLRKAKELRDGQAGD